MDLRYGIFFSIEMLHEYFQNQQCSAFDIVPAQDCVNLSKNLNLQFRSIDNKLIAMIKENDQHEPFLNAPSQKWFRKFYGEKVLRFYVKLKDPLLINYTNIEAVPLSMKKVLYFNNISKNKAGGKLYLSAPVKEYSLNKTYLPGSLVRDAATGNIFEAIKKHTLKKKASLTDEALWMPKGLRHMSKPVDDHAAGKTYQEADLVLKPGADQVFEARKKHNSTNDSELDNQHLWLPRELGILQYPTETDFIEVTAGTYSFTIPASNKAEISITGFNYDATAPAYDRSVQATETQHFDKPVTQVNIDLAGLEPGKYQVKVNNESKVLYVDPIVSPANTFGIIEIFTHLAGNDEYALLNDDEQLKSPRFTIHFPFRRVLWKYVRKDGKAQTITDIGETGYVFNLEGDAFISTIPLPLSETVCKTLKLEFNSKDFRMFPLPNPPVKRLSRYHQNDFDYFCSEVFLNY